MVLQTKHNDILKNVRFSVEQGVFGETQVSRPVKSRLVATGGFIHIIRKAQTCSTVQTFS
ncbi:hypothetical protein TH62_07825 [Bacillus sp. TH008]|nr:hypothetical protein TH62_07825 [Bacillus sp. TH008]